MWQIPNDIQMKWLQKASQPINFSTPQPINLSTDQHFNGSTNQPLFRNHNQTRRFFCIVAAQRVIAKDFLYL